MRCAILALGLRGDVHPLLAVGAGLRRAGWDVRFATQPDFANDVLAHGLEFYPLEGPSAAFFGGAGGAAARDRIRSPSEFTRLFDNYFAFGYEKLLDQLWAAAQRVDVVICWPFLRFGSSLAERLPIPVIMATACPVHYLPTAAFTNPFFDVPTPPETPLATLRTWRQSLPIARAGQDALNRWRVRTLGLAPQTCRHDLRQTRRLTHLLGYSSAVLPRPADWKPWVHQTGYWFLDSAAEYIPPPELQRFLDAGPPPVAIGFSSQAGPRGVALTRLVVGAVKRAGARAILLSGYGALKSDAHAESILTMAAVPHDWLFPRVAAVVHHGGAGSTASALRAGRPNMAVPFGYDQPLWGERLHQLGVGPAPIPAQALTVEGLADSLRDLLGDSAYGARARGIGDIIGSEDGVAAAVAAVRAASGEFTPRPLSSDHLDVVE